MRVVLAIAAVVAAALFLANLADEPGDSAADRGGSAVSGEDGTEPLEIESVTDFDPHGGDGEHQDEAPLAADGDTSTAWTTQSYSASLELLDKPGVGLVFDLGDERSVDEVTVTGSPGMDIQVLYADEVGGDETDFEIAGEASSTGNESTIDAGGAEGRYWLIWITALSQEGGGQASISEVEFSGS